MDVNDLILRDLLKPDDGAAAQSHLDAGFPIYYAEDDTPADLLIKEYPDGRRELIRFGVGDSKVDKVVKVLE